MNSQDVILREAVTTIPKWQGESRPFEGSIEALDGSKERGAVWRLESSIVWRHAAVARKAIDGAFFQFGVTHRDLRSPVPDDAPLVPKVVGGVPGEPGQSGFAA